MAQLNKFIPYGRQNIDEDDISAVAEILRSKWITQGPMIDEFEVRVAEYCGAKYAVAFNSGTSALHGALFAAGIKPGDEVITTPMSFLATANAAVYLGACPVFVDIDPNNYCLDILRIEDAITARTRAIIPVDYAGYPVNMEKIMKIARRYNLLVIEDAAHALGARRNGQIVGNQADMTMLSFHPVKHITTGEGGMIMCNNEEYYRRLKLFRSHGITSSPEQMERNEGPWYYEMQELGYNYRITDIQCALGLSQLKKLESFLEKRRQIADIYNQALGKIEWLKTPLHPPYDDSHAYHLYPVLIDPEINRRQIFDYMRSRNIWVQVHYIPIHLQPYYQKMFGYRQGDFPAAEDFYAREISLPIYPGLSEEEQDYVIEAIKATKF
ncbi:MAG: UDP-4-amino-4,6-dideoxy-N-acetyl-beta-L-altrosamine transaminase [Syntrophomonadaceae bacterium]|nr:UDP-4-amino-4,6-dideoxy-N-acetyl-beta-L-altrosamine transaminase [Syntrophomonadaceae bacterium]MDD3024363.1 UDP-4-amino-4,6-dideoxy-N-acetyl-beta-L-altrosamine transaminase [Syntrophomonadaceae bacterium]